MKRISLGIFLLLSIMLLVTGCGNKQQSETPIKQAGQEQQVVVDKDIQWSATHASMLEKYELATIDNGRIYACRYGNEGLIVSVLEADNATPVDSYVIPNVSEIKSISINSAREICLYCTIENEDVFLRINEAGEVNSIEDIQVEDLGVLPYLKNVYADSNGLYYLWYEMSVPCAEVYEDGEEDVYTGLDRIYVKDQEMNTIIYEQVPDSFGNKLVSFAFDEEGAPVLLAMDEDGYYVRKVRTTDCKEYEPNRIETSDLSNLENSGIVAFARDGLLYIAEGFLCMYHISDCRVEKLVELASVGIWEEDIMYLGLNGSNIEIIDNYKGFDHSEYTVIREGESERKCLTLGVMTLQPEMQEMIATFNRYQNEVTLETVAYVEDYDYEAGYEKLRLDIIQGKAPDLISVYGIEYESLSNVGAFVDLYTLMQKDTEISVDSLVSSVLEVYEVDSHLYMIAPAFRLYTMWGATSVVKDKNGVSVDEMIQLLQEQGGDINSIYGFSADESPLTTLCSFSMDKFIDWTEGTCNFSSTEFGQILNFVKEYEGKPLDSFYSAIRNKDILLTLGMISSVEDYCLESELYGEKVQFIGYPTESGTGVATLFSRDELAINSKSEYQQEAWEFIKFYIQNGYYGFGFPIQQEQFDRVLQEALEEEYVYENGEPVVCAKRSYMEPNIVSIHVNKCEQEDVDVIRKLVDNVSDKFQYNIQIQKIIEEEVGAYMQNQKEIEDVCSIIQRRVQLYLDERK